MSRLYYDTNVFIYAFDSHPLHGPSALRLVGASRSPDNQLFASLFVLGEVLVRSISEANEFQQARFKLFFQSPLISMLPYSTQAMLTFANLRAIYHVKPLDALHLACAAQAGVDYFITNDRKLHPLNIPGIGRIAGLETRF